MQTRSQELVFVIAQLFTFINFCEKMALEKKRIMVFEKKIFMILNKEKL